MTQNYIVKIFQARENPLDLENDISSFLEKHKIYTLEVQYHHTTSAEKHYYSTAIILKESRWD